MMIPCASGPRHTMMNEKVMSYEEKSVGSTAFFQCEACPYMALAEDDMKFHLFTEHPALARGAGLADDVRIPCPGCAAAFGAEPELRSHLRDHHRMGVRDVRKMVRSLVQLALKDVKLKRERAAEAAPPPATDEPQLIEVAPAAACAGAGLPRGLAYISLDELSDMSALNFEKVDPKDIIQEASINIVYAEAAGASGAPPDLISSVHARAPEPGPAPAAEAGGAAGARESGRGTACMVNGCHITLKEERNLAYHRRCHVGGRLACPECGKALPSVEALHTHLWKLHAVDLELPTCPVCGYKTYRRYRLTAIHMQSHGTQRPHVCAVCSKGFKTASQLCKHGAVHGARAAACAECGRSFGSARRLRAHQAAVHRGLRPFQCGHCPYAAARKIELKLHLRAHTGDKPYACERCPHRAADHNAMRRHRRTHARDPPLQVFEGGAPPAPVPAAAPAAAAPPAAPPAPLAAAAPAQAAPDAPPAGELLANFPIRLPAAAAPGAARILLTPGDKISLPAQQAGPAEEGAPRKKPKISVKSNLILKGPDQDGLFPAQAFGRLDGQFSFNRLLGAPYLPPFLKAEADKAADIKRELAADYSPPPERALDAFLLDERCEEPLPPLAPAHDVIEIDDNSDERKLPRFDHFPLESLYLMHADFPFLEPEPEPEPEPAAEPAALQGARDPMMNTCVRASNKINVKNIELMKN